jgi:hypothetical protein
MEDNDIETYLCTFERTALREGWPRPKLASLLTPCLSGNALKVYWDMNDEQAANNDRLKREILSRYRYSLAHRAQRFHDWRFIPDASLAGQMSDLLSVTRAWLLTDVSTLSILGNGPGSYLTGATPRHEEGSESICALDLGGPPGSGGDASEHSGPAKWELGRVGDPFEGTEGQPHRCIPRTDSQQCQRTANPWRECWGRADTPPTTPGRWRPKEVF